MHVNRSEASTTLNSDGVYSYHSMESELSILDSYGELES